MAPADAAPTSGWTVDASHAHVFPVRVYYEDTDAGGIVYYVNYLKFAERARTEMLRLLGHEQFDLLAREGIGFTVRSCTADYRAPARLDDALEVRTTLIDIGGASMRLRQRIERDGAILCDLRFRLAVMNRDGRPARMPQAIRDALEPHALGEDGA
jgi:acyl-CoA thioester hydrolase